MIIFVLQHIHSAARGQQPSELRILSHVDSSSRCEVVGLQVVQDFLCPYNPMVSYIFIIFKHTAMHAICCLFCFIYCRKTNITNSMFDLIDLCLVAPMEHSSPSSSFLCCHLHFLAAVLEAVDHISFSSSFLQVFFGHPFPLWFRDAHCNTCSAMLSLLFQCLRMCPSQSHFLLSWDSTGS